MEINQGTEEILRSARRPSINWMCMQIMYSALIAGVATLLFWAIIFTKYGRKWPGDGSFPNQSFAQIFHVPADALLLYNILLVVFAAVFALCFLYMLSWWKTQYYEIAPRFLFVASGPSFIDESRIPYETVEEVALKANRLSRLFGVAQVVVKHSDGTSRILGLTQNQAERLAEQLTARAQNR